MAVTQVAAGDRERMSGELAAAQTSYARALAIWEAVGATGSQTCPAQLGLGELALAHKRGEEAAGWFEQATAQCEGGEVATAREGLARARRMRAP